MRIKSKKPKGKKTIKEKKKEVAKRGFERASKTSSSEERAAFHHRAMRSLHPLHVKINNFEVSFSAIHTVLNLMELYLS